MSTTVRQAFGDMSSAGMGKLAAALLISTSGKPNAEVASEGGADLIGVADVAADGEHPGRAPRWLLSRRRDAPACGWRRPGRRRAAELGGDGPPRPVPPPVTNTPIPAKVPSASAGASGWGRLTQSCEFGHGQLPVYLGSRPSAVAAFNSAISDDLLTKV